MILLLVAISGVTMMPHDDNQLVAFMTAPENCGGTCLLGIRPGTTTLREATSHLSQLTWVTDIRENAPGNGYAQLTWAWSGNQPDIINADRRGRITFYWDDEDLSAPPLSDTVLETITIYTHIRVYTLHNWLGEANSGTATVRPDGMISYSIAYNTANGMVNLATELSCPVDLLTYWNAQTRLTISVGRGTSAYVSLADMMKLC
jgi:hypothetical protein